MSRSERKNLTYSARYNIFRSTREKEKSISRIELDEALLKMTSNTLEQLIDRYIDDEFNKKQWRVQSYLVASCIDELLLYVDTKVFTNDYINLISENVYNHCDIYFKRFDEKKDEVDKNSIEYVIEQFVENFKYPTED